MYKVLHIGPDPTLPGGIASVIATFQDNAETFTENGFTLSFFSTYPFKGKKSFIRIITSAPAFLRAINNSDLLHFHVASKGSFFRKFFYFMTGKIFNKKTLFHLHGAAFFEFMDNSSASIQKMIDTFLKSADSVATVSNEFKRELSSRIKLEKEIVVIPNSSAEFEALSSLPIKPKACRENYILFAGRLTEDKGLGELIEAISILKKSGSPIKLVIAGNGEIAVWEALARKHNVFELIQFEGWVSGKEKIELYLGCTLFCLPSHVESFGISALEAMLAKKPLVCTNIGGFLDLLIDGENGFSVNPKSPHNLAKHIKILISAPELAAQMGNNGFDRAMTNFTTQIAMAKTIACYENLVK